MILDKFFKILAPKNDDFFLLFEKDIANLLKIAELLCQLMTIQDSSQWAPIIRKIKDLEKAGDGITSEIFDKLDKSFITPFDREDIYALASNIDDVADNVNRACNRIMLFKPKVFMPEFADLANLILESTKLIVNAIAELKQLKNFQKLTDICIQISTMESKADDLYHLAISRLFEKEANSVELIKIKDILESLERATDKAKNVSNVFKTIIIKST